MTVWLVLSFLLHLITLFALIVLYQRSSSADRSQPTYDPQALTEQLDAFVKQIEQENEAYYQNMLAHLKDLETEWEIKVNQLNQASSREAADPPQPDTYGEKVFDRAIHLHQQGYTPEQIARQLNIGIGEAQLLVRLFEKHC
ncbi:hypothetical protein J2S00_000059 [Caldalkalibacillus uzonensis]|uniref:DUF2802 domain-containing protein n=1 Tax=Caldalkalibacillus uzonensis TaxID=353224 RepID=A0ABU0CLI8_9BACI|nr:hypothetical protein [Caldalkalibacillus uzonensis]MDQ0337289.1 hypothetical protein [Caldalkalibacillus uzonensis]